MTQVEGGESRVRNKGSLASTRMKILILTAVMFLLIFSVWADNHLHGIFLSSDDKFTLNKPYPQDSTEQYNLLSHGGGLQPFFPHRGFGINPEVPTDCVVDQVHLLLRHGERYPSTADGNSQRDMILKLQEIEIRNNTGPLSFIKDYEYFAQSSDFEQLSTRGVYNGAHDAYLQGLSFHKAYNHLYDPLEKFPVFAASDKRVVDTATFFTKGFLRENYTEKAAIQVIPETREQGANSLAPSTFCNTYDREMNNHLIDEFPSEYLTNVVSRFEKLSPDYKGHLTEKYIFQMMTICLFELNTNGSSKWCDLFEQDEWINFAYQRDLIFYYQSSFGHEKSMGIGSNYINATKTLLQDTQTRENIFVSFTHDTDITPILVPLGLFDNDDGKKLSTKSIDFNSPFKSSQIVPMGARIIFERLKWNDSHFVRIKVGGTVIPLRQCTSGPGFSCPLEVFLEIIDKNLNGTTYLDTCKTDKGLPQYLSFFWDWKLQNYSD